MNALFDRFLSPSLLAARPEVKRRARLVVAVALLLVTPVVLFSIQWIVQGKWADLATNSIAACCYIGALVMLKKRGSIFAAANLIAGPMMLISLSFAFGSGGFTQVGAATWPWAVLAVLISYLLGGRTTGRIWAAVYFAAIVVAFVAGRGGLLPPSPPPGDDVSHVVSIVMLSFMLIGVITFYESMNDQMLASLDEAGKRMRLVLDNVGEGFLLVRSDGSLTPERSRAVEHWFGAGTKEAKVWDYIGGDDTHATLSLQLGWDELVADILPRDVLLEQMPARLKRGARTFQLRYRVIGEGQIDHVVVVVKDVTHEVAAKHADEERVEAAELSERVIRDPDGFRVFLSEAKGLVDLARSDDVELRGRALHTLKGAAGFIGAQRVAAWCHILEDRIAGGDDLGPADHAELRERLNAVESRFAPMLRIIASRVQIDEDDVERARALVRSGAPHAVIDAVLHSWRGEPLRALLERLGEQASLLGRRLGRGEIAVDVECASLRVPRGALDAFATACTHVVRNAVDHGFDVDAGPLPRKPIVRLSAEDRGDVVVIRVADNGRGIDWARLAAKAKERGLPCATQAERVAVLFADGVSTRETVTDVSGRGVGMAAVKDVVERMGGSIDVVTEAGEGTTFSFTLPAATLRFGGVDVVEAQPAMTLH